MDERDETPRKQDAIIKEVRKHLLKAQTLIDAIDPSSIMGARLEQLIYELDKEPGVAAAKA